MAISDITQCKRKKQWGLPVNPRVTNTVRELLLLPPEDGVRQVSLSVRRAVKRLSQDVLLHLGSTIFVNLLVSALGEHFVFGIDVHRDFEERLVKEGHTGFETPSHGGLVGTETVGSMEVLHSLDAFFVEVLGVGSGVEVKVTCFR